MKKATMCVILRRFIVAFCGRSGETRTRGLLLDVYKRQRFARLAAVRGTEAIQPNDGRFTILREQSEWMSRHAHAVEKFCMFFHSAEEARQYLPRFTAIRGVEVVQRCV